MPRNASGTYTLPSGNPVVSGTLIDATWANNTMADLGNEVTDSLSRSGEGAMLAPLRITDGVQATPSLAFSNEPSSGLYRAGTNEWWSVAAGVQVQQHTSTGAVTRFAAGAVGTPSVSAFNDVNTGIWFPAADTLAVSTAGVEALRVNSSGVLSLVNNPTLSGGTANGVLFLNGSKVATSGSALTFNGTNTFTVIPATGTAYNRTESTQYSTWMQTGAGNANVFWEFSAGTPVRWVDTSAGELMRLTSTSLYTASGVNVGIGTSSPASKLHVSNTAAATRITITDDVAAGRSGYIESNYSDALVIGTTSGVRGIRFSPDNTPRMLLDTLGNLGIGTSSPEALLTVSKSTSGGEGGYIYLDNPAASASGNKAGIKFGTSSGASFASVPTGEITNVIDNSGNGASALTFGTFNGTSSGERARITSGGFFKASNTGTYSSSTNDRYEFTSDKNDLTILVNSTNTGANVNNVYSVLPAAGNAAAYHFAGVITGSGLQFTVDADGDVKNTNNSYGSISDIKLKQDVVDAASQWDDIKALRVRKYRFKRNPDAALQIGLVAQEAEAVSPGLVEETADRDEEGDDLGTTTKSVKYSVLYMKAVKALQEAMTRIEQLEAKVAALEIH
jgi:hypothetical protein